MPKKAKRPCSYKGCPNLVVGESSYCAEHEKVVTRRYNKFIRPPEHSKRYDYRWRKIRTMFLNANPFCERCKSEGRYTLATEIHHILPLADGGTHDVNNLMPLCKTCHGKIHGTKKNWS